MLEKEKKILIVARCYSEYLRCLKERGLSFVNTIYISDNSKMLGWKDPDIILFGHWWLNPNIDSYVLEARISAGRFNLIK